MTAGCWLHLKTPSLQPRQTVPAQRPRCGDAVRNLQGGSGVARGNGTLGLGIAQKTTATNGFDLLKSFSWVYLSFHFFGIHSNVEHFRLGFRVQSLHLHAFVMEMFPSCKLNSSAAHIVLTMQAVSSLGG